MQKPDQIDVYGSMFDAMLNNGVIAFTVKNPEQKAMLGLKAVDAAKAKDRDVRDPIDQLMLLAYYRNLRINQQTKSDGAWHAGREGGIISRLLHDSSLGEAPLYAMAEFLLSETAHI